MNTNIVDLIEFTDDEELKVQRAFTIKHAETGEQAMYGGLVCAGAIAVFRNADSSRLVTLDAAAESTVTRNNMKCATLESIVKVLSKSYAVRVEAGLEKPVPVLAAEVTVPARKPSTRCRNLVRELSAVGDLQPSERQRAWAQKDPANWKHAMAWAHNDASIELTQDEIGYVKALYKSLGIGPLLINKLYH